MLTVAQKPSTTGPAALTIDSIGKLALRDITMVAGTRTLLVDLDSSLSAGDRFVIQRLHGMSEGSDLVASGELTSVAKRTGTLTVDAQSLDLDGLLAFLAAATPAGAAASPSPAAAPPPPAAVPMHLDVAVKARQGHAAGAAFTNLETAANVRGSVVTLEGLKMGIFGGRFDGTVGFDGTKGSPRYQWRGAVENLDVPAIVAFAGAPGAMTGRLSGTMALAASGLDPQAALERARGTARIAVTDGRVPNLDLVRKVVLAFGKPTGDAPAARAKSSRASRPRWRLAAGCCRPTI